MRLELSRVCSSMILSWLRVCCPEDLPRAMNDREEWRVLFEIIQLSISTQFKCKYGLIVKVISISNYSVLLKQFILA